MWKDGSSPTGAKAGEHRQRGPDVAGEMEGVCGEGGRAGAAGDGAQLARAPEIDGNGSEKHQNRPHGVVDFARCGAMMRSTASQMIHAQETAIRPTSPKEEMFSILPWP